VSIYFSKIYFWVGDYFKKISSPYKRLLLGGVLLGTVVYFIPPLFGEGFASINNVLKGNITAVVKNNIFHTATDSIWIVVALLGGLVLFKVVAMSLTFGAGGIGGVFAPTLFTGSVFGYLIALVINNSNMFTHGRGASCSFNGHLFDCRDNGRI
jgi:CIC family chloride channel protein